MKSEGRMGENEEKGGQNFFLPEMKRIKQTQRITLEVAFSLLLRWALVCKGDSIKRTRTTRPYS